MWVLASSLAILGRSLSGIRLLDGTISSFTVKKIRVFKAGLMPLNTIAWNNRIGLRHYFVGLRTEAMINRDNWGYSYFVVRGEILGSMKDELLRKHLPRMFSLIKTES